MRYYGNGETVQIIHLAYGQEVEDDNLRFPLDAFFVFYLHLYLGLIFPFHCRCIYIKGLVSMEKEMETHSSILAWKIPWTEEPGGLQSIGSQRVRHD